ncbi:MAG: hypothetical protein KAH07_07635 [Flavobacteriaceae bacterium]|nr:hypothetical protein [Flavobacteriaceae bacterium]
MKKTILKQPLIYLSLLLVMAISFNSCDDDDDTKTLLETYAGTVWKNTEAGIIVRFNSDLSIILESWVNEKGDCYEYDTFEDAMTIDVFENTENKLLIRVHRDGGMETITFTEIDNTISVHVEENGIYSEAYTIILTPSDVDIRVLEVCE